MTGDILSDINSFLNGKIPGYDDIIYIDLFPAPAGDTEESKAVIMSRHDPSTFSETRYMDKSRIGNFNFAYHAKSGDLEQARSWLDRILSLLDFEDFTDISEVMKIKTEAQTSPVFVGKTDKNEYIYTASLTLEYYKEG